MDYEPESREENSDDAPLPGWEVDFCPAVRSWLMLRAPIATPEWSVANALAQDRHPLEPVTLTSPHRLMIIGSRLARGAYDRPDVLEMIARRIHDRGDL
jgi:hypothetical protein